jgi:hypothetical protein
MVLLGALQLAREVSELRKTICSIRRNGYQRILQLIAVVLFQIKKFGGAAVVWAKVIYRWSGHGASQLFNTQIGR